MIFGRLTLIGGFLTLALATGPAMAGARSAVSLQGSDTGTCPVATPCRTLAYALTQTSVNGQILVLDSAGYGQITITQSVTINAPPGTIGFISAVSGDAVTINAGPNDLVIITGMYLDGHGTGTNGVQVNTVGSFSIGGSTITGFTGSPINYVNSSSGNQKLTITNSSIYGNGGSILMKPTAGVSLFSSIRGLSLSSSGIVVDSTSSSSTNMGVLFDNSILRYNGGTAITVNSGGVGFTQAHVANSQIFSSNLGLSANGVGAAINMTDSTFMNMTTLCSTSGGGSVNTYQNNAVSVAAQGCTLTPRTVR